LALDSNNLTGDLPFEMGNLKNLEYLALANNELTGEIPEGFKNLDKLDYFSIENNLFSEIPEFTQIDSLFASEMNHLTFEDFEKNLDLIRDSTVEVSYSPQLPFGKEYTVTVVEDNTYTLPIPCGGEYNHYKWFKDGVEITKKDTSCYLFSPLKLSDTGSYTVSVTNDSVKDLTLHSLPVHLVVKEHCIRNDSLALVAFFYATEGWNWKYRNNWLATPVRNWMGITADSCHVLKIDLPDNNLQGDLSLIMGDSQFGNAYFTELNHLYLDHNQLSGEFPVQLCALPALAELNLSSNDLSSEIPPEIGNLSQLTILQLDSNRFYDAIPDEIGNLSKLKILSIKNNQLRGEIPGETGNLKNLETLALGGNSLSGSIPSSIGNLTNLSMLSLESNVFDGNIPDEFANLKSLEYLWLFNNQLEGTIPVGIGNLKELVEVQLQQNNLTGMMPSGFGTLTHIELLDLSYNRLSGGIPDDIGYSNNLNSVKIDHNYFDDVPDLSGMDSLFYCSVNCLTFEDFEKNLDLFRKEGFDYSYSPQRNFGREHDTTAYEGAPFTLTIPCGGQYNHYSWFKENVKMASVADASELYFPQVQLSDTGSYYITVWNDSVPDLTLTSYPVHLKMNGVVTLISPADYSIDEPVDLYTLWEQAPWADSYTLQVSTSSDFSSRVVNQSRIASTSYYVSELDSGTTYYWRVNASDSISTCGWSDVWDFTTVPKIPDVPVLKSPEDGSVDLDTSLVLSWYEANRAASYNLQVSTSPDFNSLVVNQSGITSTESLVSGLDHLTTYYWRVSATNVSGTSGWSETWKFTTLQPIPDHLDFINLVIIDGQHEPKFIVGGIEFFPENNLLVFSRWGKKVFSKTGYNNELDFSSYPAGTYYYILNVKMLDGQKQFKSFVDVVKN
ncbi:MAG TPA: gliding motility-associated C-terminal domain-containing protein, partial [Prolixibacteraceae bacterium]|nr:gliding motility-associated C-terminal domain-containing protein [Prolixibacteraceae bacterium]